MALTGELLQRVGDRDEDLLGPDEDSRVLTRDLASGTEVMRGMQGRPSRFRKNPDGTFSVSSRKIASPSSGTWLPPEPAEDPDEYFERVRRSYLTPFYRDAIDLNVGRVFARSPVLEAEENDPVADLAESIDSQGSHWTQFSRGRFWKAVHDGASYIFVDFPRVSRSEDDEDGDNLEADETRRPFWTAIDASQVLGIKLQRHESMDRLVEFRFSFMVREPDPESLGTREVERVMRLVAGVPGGAPPFFEVYEKDERGWVFVEEGPIERPRIEGERASVAEVEAAFFLPIVPIITRRVGPFRGQPFFRDLADLNLQHFQKKSDLDRIMHAANVPILFGAGFEDAGKAQIGAFRFIPNKNEQAKLGYVEHTGSAIGKAMEDLEHLERAMLVASLDPMIRKPTGSETATGRAIDEARAQSSLAALALGLQDSLENAFKFTANWLGRPEGPVVSISTDFGISLRPETETQVLLQAAVAGQLSTSAFVEEMRRRGVVSEELDVDEEVEEIERQGPGLGETGDEEEEEEVA